MGEVQVGQLQQVPLRANALKEHDELELEEDHRVDARPTTLGVAIPGPLPHEAEFEPASEVAVEVVRRDEGLERDSNWAIQATQLGWAEHLHPPRDRRYLAGSLPRPPARAYRCPFFNGLSN